MNDFYSSSSVVLAHGIDMSASSGIYLLIVLALFIFSLLIFRKNANIKRLFISSIIPYILVLICILHFSLKLQIPKIIGYSCFAAVLYPNFLIDGALGMGAGFFLAAFIIDTLVIFAIVRLILFIKHKISAKKLRTKQAV